MDTNEYKKMSTNDDLNLNSSLIFVCASVQ